MVKRVRRWKMAKFMFWFIFLYQSLTLYIIFLRGSNVPFFADAQILPRSSNAPDINYGGIHPFEQLSKSSQQNRIAQSVSSHRPIRIVFDISQIQIEGDESKKTKITALLDTILPQTATIWSSALLVTPVKGNLIIGADVSDVQGRFSNCESIPQSHSITGVRNADIVIYVSIDGPECVTNIGTILPIGVPCELDQFDRPIAGKSYRMYPKKYEFKYKESL